MLAANDGVPSAAAQHARLMPLSIPTWFNIPRGRAYVLSRCSRDNLVKSHRLQLKERIARLSLPRTLVHLNRGRLMQGFWSVANRLQTHLLSGALTNHHWVRLKQAEVLMIPNCPAHESTRQIVP